MLASDARIVGFDDGVVLFDPVSWAYRTMAAPSLELLELLREHVERGERGRDALMRGLADAMLEDGEGPVELTDAGRADLLDWIDLARHLYG